MKRGESYGGGQSSLGYLFGSDSKKKNKEPQPSPTTYLPPYGIDMGEDKPPRGSSSPSQEKSSKEPNNYPRVQGNAGNIITGRPSTKVKSAPGGDSSLGYLFEDKP